MRGRRERQFVRHPLCFFAVGAIIAGGQRIGAQPAYTIQHIPGLQNNFFVARIGDSGHVVSGNHLWYQGTITDLGGLGGNFTAVEGVNAIGQVVGRSSAANGYMQPFLWQNGIMRALPNLGGEEGYATAINNAGQVVGYTDNISGGSVSTRTPK